MSDVTMGIVQRPADLPDTELRNPRSSGLHGMSSMEILTLLNAEDRVAVDAAAAALPELSRLVDESVARVRDGGHIHYFGAGTSGRLGVLDAAELVPTFGVDRSLVQAWIAGGKDAIVSAVEGAEDSSTGGHRAASRVVGAGDVAIGLTVSGTTPYVDGALRSARDTGAFTALITSNPASPLAQHADIAVVAGTGAEVLTGSTRLKAGTATKILLNGFSTGVMVGLGRVYSNLMVSVVPSNQKLRERTLRILHEVTGAPVEQDADLLDEARGDLSVAVVSAAASVTVQMAREALRVSGSSVPKAVQIARVAQ